MKNLIILIVILIPNLLSGQPHRVALTIDDLPFVYTHNLDSLQKQQLFRSVLDTLSSRNVEATGFVIAANLKGNEHLFECMLDSGHAIGNHSYTHPDLNKVSAEKYCKNIMMADSILAKYMQVNYFRYPFLRMGNTKEKKDSVMNFLDANGYMIAEVTIDNNEWLYNREYCDALAEGDTQKAEKMGEEYLEHMVERAEYYLELAAKISPRPINHILLVHMNLLNSRYIGRLIDEYQAMGFQFITLDEAMQDPVLGIEDDYLGACGRSKLEKIHK